MRCQKHLGLVLSIFLLVLLFLNLTFAVVIHDKTPILKYKLQPSDTTITFQGMRVFSDDILYKFTYYVENDTLIIKLQEPITKDKFSVEYNELVTHGGISNKLHKLYTYDLLEQSLNINLKNYDGGTIFNKKNPTITLVSNKPVYLNQVKNNNKSVSVINTTNDNLNFNMTLNLSIGKNNYAFEFYELNGNEMKILKTTFEYADKIENSTKNNSTIPTTSTIINKTTYIDNNNNSINNNYNGDNNDYINNDNYNESINNSNKSILDSLKTNDVLLYSILFLILVLILGLYIKRQYQLNKIFSKFGRAAKHAHFVVKGHKEEEKETNERLELIKKLELENKQETVEERNIKKIRDLIRKKKKKEYLNFHFNSNDDELKKLNLKDIHSKRKTTHSKTSDYIDITKLKTDMLLNKKKNKASSSKTNKLNNNSKNIPTSNKSNDDDLFSKLDSLDD